MTEAELKTAIKEGQTRLYVLYGEEGYLVSFYADQIAKTTVKDDLGGFNLQRMDGQELDFDRLEEAVEAMPLMAEKKCVLVRDYDAAADAAHQERLLNMLAGVPDECVLVFWQMTVQPDGRKSARWKEFLKTAEQNGAVVQLGHRETGDTAKLLVSGAKRRGVRLEPADARYMVEQAGNDLNLLLNELDKLTALAEDGVVTRKLIDRAGTKNLEARVFDLSKAILAGQTERAYNLLKLLFIQREEPLAVLGVLSTAYADLYRAKAALAAGVPVTVLGEDFKSYKGKDFRLRNAARDSARLSVEVLRQSLEVLARADTALKSGRGGERVLLEETVTRLAELARGR